MPPRKIPVDILRKVIFKNLGASRDEVTLRPSAGIDGAVINIGNKSLIISMDPITGALEKIGWKLARMRVPKLAKNGFYYLFFGI